jgi:hypothetical protein
MLQELKYTKFFKILLSIIYVSSSRLIDIEISEDEVLCGCISAASTRHKYLRTCVNRARHQTGTRIIFKILEYLI